MTCHNEHSVVLSSSPPPLPFPSLHILVCASACLFFVVLHVSGFLAASLSVFLPGSVSIALSAYVPLWPEHLLRRAVIIINMANSLPSPPLPPFLSVSFVCLSLHSGLPISKHNISCIIICGVVSFVWLSACLSGWLFFCLSFFLSVCLFVCLFPSYTFRMLHDLIS